MNASHVMFWEDKDWDSVEKKKKIFEKPSFWTAQLRVGR